MLQQVGWRQILKNNFTQWGKLADYLDLTPSQREEILKSSHFILNLPLRLAEKIPKQTLDDPILKQFLPHKLEKEKKIGFTLDPTEDKSFLKSSKLLQKYEGRALLVTTSACAMHCRYCFRQNFPYETARKSYDEELVAIENDLTLKEIILSGGDPLSVSNETLRYLLARISACSHVKRLRFHTRFPIGIPERLDEEFISLLENLSQQVYFVIHCNHVNELDDDILSYLKKLKKIGVVVLNQAVLLRGVNDCSEALYALSEKLVDNGILPYYLHQLDQVQGTSHFEVEIEKGRRLIESLTAKISGYAVPKFVKEIPHRASKTDLLQLPCLS
ncbi:MAG: KamA family radical SAM protein [Parachlamydiaceae bacterium]